MPAKGPKSKSKSKKLAAPVQTQQQVPNALQTKPKRVVSAETRKKLSLAAQAQHDREYQRLLKRFHLQGSTFTREEYELYLTNIATSSLYEDKHSLRALEIIGELRGNDWVVRGGNNVNVAVVNNPPLQIDDPAEALAMLEAEHHERAALIERVRAQLPVRTEVAQIDVPTVTIEGDGMDPNKDTSRE